MEKPEEDIRSEIVRDYLDRTPSTLVQWSTFSILVALVTALILCWIIQYPLIVRSEFILSMQQIPKPVVSRMDGRLEKILCANKQMVSEGQILAFLESSAKHEEILVLQHELDSMKNVLRNEDVEALDKFHFTHFEHLGEVQPSYQLFRQQLTQIISLFGKDYYQQRRKLLEDDIQELKKMDQYLNEQLEYHERDAELAEKEFEIHRNLYLQKVISILDLEREESKMLTRKSPVKNTKIALLSNSAKLRSIEKEMLDLDKLAIEQKQLFQQSVNSLSSNIQLWRNRYLLVSPAQGELTFRNNLQEKQNIATNTELFYVFVKSEYMGILSIPQNNIGKVQIGQRVLIKFLSYPFEEYGTVEGRIASIPQISAENANSFSAVVELPQGLTTSHHKTLAYNYHMAASAEIITEETRLLERIFYSIRRILN